MMKFKKGDSVVQVVTPIKGSVSGLVLVDDVPHYLVSWTDEAGDVHERPFTEDQLEAGATVDTPVPDAPGDQG